MDREEIIRAWKNPMFRASLDSRQLSALPANPAGMMELTDADLEAINGGATTVVIIIVIIATLTLCTTPVN